MQVQIFNTDGDDEKKKNIKISTPVSFKFVGKPNKEKDWSLKIGNLTPRCKTTLWYLKNLRILDAEAGVLSEGSAENGGGEVGESTVDGPSEERK